MGFVFYRNEDDTARLGHIEGRLALFWKKFFDSHSIGLILLMTLVSFSESRPTDQRRFSWVTFETTIRRSPHARSLFDDSESDATESGQCRDAIGTIGHTTI